MALGVALAGDSAQSATPLLQFRRAMLVVLGLCVPTTPLDSGCLGSPFSSQR